MIKAYLYPLAINGLSTKALLIFFTVVRVGLRTRGNHTSNHESRRGLLMLTEPTLYKKIALEKSVVLKDFGVAINFRKEAPGRLCRPLKIASARFLELPPLFGLIQSRQKKRN